MTEQQRAEQRKRLVECVEEALAEAAYPDLPPPHRWAEKVVSAIEDLVRSTG